MKGLLKGFQQEILQKFDGGNTSVAQLANEYRVAESSMRALLYRNKRRAIRPVPVYQCNLSPVEAAYIAGLLDGEGCLFARKVVSRKSQCVQGGIAVAMTSKALLEGLCLLSGVGKVRPNPVKHAHLETCKPCWRWDISQQAVVPLLEKVMPYMRLKKERAELLLELALLKRQSTTGKAYKMERQLEIMRRMQEMNRTGVDRLGLQCATKTEIPAIHLFPVRGAEELAG